MKNLKPIQLANKLKNITKINVFENTRKREVVGIRMLLCYLLREKLGMRWTNIALFFANNNKPMTHATAMHSYKMYPVYKKHNKKLKEYERMFTFKSDLTYDEIDRIHYLENQIKYLLNKLDHPLIALLEKIPQYKYDETFERLDSYIKSWEWKNNETKKI
tara:strand:+ start:244 stop:726 length:483 start_codon:yes stop_codon:yes gene_type:complete